MILLRARRYRTSFSLIHASHNDYTGEGHQFLCLGAEFYLEKEMPVFVRRRETSSPSQM